MLKYVVFSDLFGPHFGHQNKQFHYIDTDSFTLSLNTDDIVNVLRTLEDLVDSTFSTKNTFFSDENEIFTGKCKMETDESFWLNEFD